MTYCGIGNRLTPLSKLLVIQKGPVCLVLHMLQQIDPLHDIVHDAEAAFAVLSGSKQHFDSPGHVE